MQNSGQIEADGGVAALMLIQYHDIFDHPFESDFCFYLLQNGDVFYCSNFANKIKDCESEACAQ
jgi:hypothetical protein